MDTPCDSIIRRYLRSTRMLLGVLIWLAPMAFAQIVSIEVKEPSGKPRTFEGGFSLVGSGNSGNTDKSNFELSGRLQWNDSRGYTFLVGDYHYGKSDNVKDEDKTFAHLRHVWLARAPFSWEAFLQAGKDAFTRLEFRGLAGGGGRWRLKPGENRGLVYLGLGGFFSREKIEERLGSDLERVDQFRINSYASYKGKPTPTTQLAGTVFFQPDVEQTNDFRALCEVALQAKFSESVALSLALDISHDSEPPQGVEKTDTAYSAGFSFSF